jgi:hypothetical protein
MIPLELLGKGQLSPGGDSLTWHRLSPVCFCSRLLRNCTIFLVTSVFPEPLCPLQEREAPLLLEAGRASRRGTWDGPSEPR